MRILRQGLLWSAVCAATLIAPTIAQADIQVSSTASAAEVRVGETVQFTTTVTNTGPEALDPRSAGLLGLRAESEKYVPNPYLSATTAVGACNTDPSAQPYDYNGARCELPALAPGESTQIVATVEVNESMDQLSSVSQSDLGGLTVFDTTTVRAIYPPEVVGSSKVKIKGLPESCVDRDLDLTVSSKGAKKITAKLAGPWDEWHGQLEGNPGFAYKIGNEKGRKLQLEVPLGGEPPGFYEVGLIAKFEGKPKQKADVTIQRC